MLKSDIHLDTIISKLTHLEGELSKYASIGMFSLHKSTEDFIGRILNLTFDYRLENLNKETKNYPGLDLGDTIKKVAFQVSTQKNSTKIEETLKKVLRFRHYEKFHDIYFFVLGKKNPKYIISTITEPHFTFDPVKNILDFTDLVHRIKYLPIEKKEAIYNFILSELPSDDSIIESDTNTKGTTTLIDLNKYMELYNTDAFMHWSVKLSIRGKRYTVAELYRRMSEFYRSSNLRQNLWVFNLKYQKHGDANEMNYEYNFEDHRNIDGSLQSKLQIKESQLHLEFAKYGNSGEVMTTNLNFEMCSLFSLIYFLDSLNWKDKFPVQVDIDLTTNTQLAFNRFNTIIMASLTPGTYYLNPREIRYSQILTEKSNREIIALIREVLDKFILERPGSFLAEPFIRLDEKRQEAELNVLQNQHNDFP